MFAVLTKRSGFLILLQTNIIMRMGRGADSAPDPAVQNGDCVVVCWHFKYKVTYRVLRAPANLSPPVCRARVKCPRLYLEIAATVSWLSWVEPHFSLLEP